MERSAAGQCPSSWHAQTLWTLPTDPRNVVRSLTLHYHHDNTDEIPTGSSKTGSGAKAEDTQDLAGPAKA